MPMEVEPYADAAAGDVVTPTADAAVLSRASSSDLNSDAPRRRYPKVPPNMKDGIGSLANAVALIAASRRSSSAEDPAASDTTKPSATGPRASRKIMLDSESGTPQYSVNKNSANCQGFLLSYSIAVITVLDKFNNIEIMF